MRIKLGDFRAALERLGVVGVSESCFGTIMYISQWKRKGLDRREGRDLEESLSAFSSQQNTRPSADRWAEDRISRVCGWTDAILFNF